LRAVCQVSVSPTRFLPHERVNKQFIESFVGHAKTLNVGDGMEASTNMGSMANPRRITTMEAFIGEAAQKGATVQTGGRRDGAKGISSSRPC
jgi:succinate-semialdehyde dehydrogenase/glutarate-semialdehyde dehydrogenase